MVSEIFLKIYGQVHGVGFRYHAEKTARSLKLAGYVRNANGGTVEILAQGKKENLEKLMLKKTSHLRENLILCQSLTLFFLKTEK